MRETRKYPALWICGTHWRRHCPPRSLRRRTYHRFFRLAKLHGWGWKGDNNRHPRLDWRFDQFFANLIRIANAAEEAQQIDMTEINKLFGWTE